MFIRHLLFTLCLAILTVVLYYNSRDLVYPSSVYINSLLILLGLVTLIHGYRCFREYGKDENAPKVSKRAVIKVVIGLIAAMLFVFLIPVIGFYTTSFLYFLGCVHYFNPEKTGKSLVIAIIASLGGTVFLYLLFTIILKVPTPAGFLI